MSQDPPTPAEADANASSSTLETKAVSASPSVADNTLGEEMAGSSSIVALMCGASDSGEDGKRFSASPSPVSEQSTSGPEEVPPIAFNSPGSNRSEKGRLEEILEETSSGAEAPVAAPSDAVAPANEGPLDTVFIEAGVTSVQSAASPLKEEGGESANRDEVMEDCGRQALAADADEMPTSDVVVDKDEECEGDEGDPESMLRDLREESGPRPSRNVPESTAVAGADDDLVCILCSCKFDPVEWLCCRDCHTWYHASCLDPPLEVGHILKDSWQCSACKTCETCNTEGDVTLLLICAKCDKAFHTHCMDPPLETVPQYDWHCEACVDCLVCSTQADGDWVQCDTCAGWVHVDCDADGFLGAQKDYHCPSCRIDRETASKPKPPKAKRKPSTTSVSAVHCVENYMAAADAYDPSEWSRRDIELSRKIKAPNLRVESFGGPLCVRMNNYIFPNGYTIITKFRNHNIRARMFLVFDDKADERALLTGQRCALESLGSFEVRFEIHDVDRKALIAVHKSCSGVWSKASRKLATEEMTHSYSGPVKYGLTRPEIAEMMERIRYIEVPVDERCRNFAVARSRSKAAATNKRSKPSLSLSPALSPSPTASAKRKSATKKSQRSRKKRLQSVPSTSESEFDDIDSDYEDEEDEDLLPTAMGVESEELRRLRAAWRDVWVRVLPPAMPGRCAREREYVKYPSFCRHRLRRPILFPTQLFKSEEYRRERFADVFPVNVLEKQVRSMTKAARSANSSAQNTSETITVTSAAAVSSGGCGTAGERSNAFEPEDFRVSWGRSPIHQWGIFATAFIQPNEPIMEYKGELFRESLSDRRERFYELQNADCYMFTHSTDYIVDATRTGNIARLINHSCDPNAYARTVNLRGRRRIMLFARRTIAPGEEIAYNYYFNREPGEQRLPCMCNASTCNGFMN